MNKPTDDELINRAIQQWAKDHDRGRYGRDYDQPGRSLCYVGHDDQGIFVKLENALVNIVVYRYDAEQDRLYLDDSMREQLGL